MGERQEGRGKECNGRRRGGEEAGKEGGEMGRKEEEREPGGRKERVRKRENKRIGEYGTK